MFLVTKTGCSAWALLFPENMSNINIIINAKNEWEQHKAEPLKNHDFKTISILFLC